MTDYGITGTVDGRMFSDQSVLDQGLSYPAVMSALPTSTPNTTRKTRRSWFETTPKGMKFEIAVEKPVLRQSTRRRSEDVEVLTLTHFTAAPRLGFGSLKPGQVKTCTLLLRNPHDYEQTVSVEKVPEKKHFTVSCRTFSVGPGETYPLDVMWAPQDVGNFREMILLQVDQSYRLQAYVFGAVVAPPQKKKVRKGGLLATKATARPKGKVEKGRMVKKISSDNLENVNPGTEKDSLKGSSTTRSQTFSRKPMAEASMQMANKIPSKANTEERIPRKKMRRSDTYSNVSGLGLTIPVIQGNTVQGHTDTRHLNTDTCNISGIQAIDVSPITSSVRQAVNSIPSFIETEEKTSLDRNCVEPSFLEQEHIGTSVSTRCTKVSEPSFLEQPDLAVVKDIVHDASTMREDPSFLELGGVSSSHTKKVPSQLATVKCGPSFHDSLEVFESSVNHPVELPSFLMSDGKENSKAPKPRRSARRSGKVNVERDEKSAEVKLIRGIKRRKSGRQIVSPDSFVRETCLKNKERPAGSDSLRRPLNDSVGQSSILEQLKNIRSFIHEKSFEIEKSVDDSFSAEKTDCVSELAQKETFVNRRQSPRLNTMTVGDEIRHETFVKTNATKLKMLASQKPSCASPRRTTFTVVKEIPKASPLTRSRSEGSPAVTTEAVEYEQLDGNVVHRTEQHVQVSAITPGTTEIVDVAQKNIRKSLRLSRGFSLDSLENHGSEKEADASPKSISADSLEEEVFDKVSELPSHHVEIAEEFTRRATLTVTKSRPSDALLDYAQRNGKVPVALFVPSPVQDQKHTTILSQAGGDGTCTHTSGLSDHNSTFEVSAGQERSGALNVSFPITPQQLPASPNPDLSRRSTHVVDKPKVLDISTLDRRQLFCRDEGQTCMLEHSVGILEQKLEQNEVEQNEISETDLGQSVSNKAIYQELEISNVCENTSESDGKCLSDSHEHDINLSKELLSNRDINIKCYDLNSPSNTTHRRKLSARRSIKSPDDLSTDPCKSRDSDSQCAVAGGTGLVFIPVEDKPVRKTTTSRKDPRQFLKKRTNPVTQAEDARVKRIKSEPAASLDKGRQVPQPAAGLDKGRQVPQPAAGLDKGRQVPQAKMSTRITRQTGKPEKASSDGRQVLKPKSSIVKGLAQSKLILTKKSKSVLPKHPLPFAAKNMYYDERWMEKQERGFVNWLNFILTPAEEYNTSNVKVKVDAGKLSVELGKGSVKLAPTNEALSLRAYSAHRRLNRLRRAACRLFQSESVVRIIQKVEGEVESGRLAVRKDRMLHADLGAKQKILDMLLSYNPLWLRIGLETIYGEVVPLQTNMDVFGLSRYIVTRLLANPDITEEYAHPTVPHLYRDGYGEASAQHTLKRFLILVYFLDRAKLDRLLDHNPCLFCKDSDVKASKDLLIQFSRDFLSGEGDITRHLSYMGYKTTYTQTALDEFDFAVSKLRTDLRDGLRLTRVVELLCARTDLSATLRVPAISRLQKVHNVEVVMKTLAAQSVDTGGVTARDVVDGHQEKTLRLLWCMILHYQVALLVNEEQLREEIHILQDSLRVRNQICHLRTHQHKTRRESKESALHTQNEKLDLVLSWCRAVCAFYNIQVENFTVSFSDGRALCHIVHHYHPGLLPLDRIHTETTVTHLEDSERNTMLHDSASFNDSCDSAAMFTSTQDPAVFEGLLNNERDNFRLLSEKVRELGGVPLMLRWTDMCNTIPDEKVVITYVLYLCARLLDIRHESRAACTIQRAWRKRCLRKLQEQHTVQNRAACMIQQRVRVFLQRRRDQRRLAAAVDIQRVWRGYRARREASGRRREIELQKQTEAVTLLQVAVRRYVHRRRYLNLRSFISHLQACCHGYLLRKRRTSAAVTIQSVYRGHLVRRSISQQCKAAVVIQACARGHLVRHDLRKQRDAAVVVQRQYRASMQMRECRQDFLQQRQSCVMIQQAWRRHLLKCEQRRTNAAVTIQAAVRSWLVRREIGRMHVMAVKVQAWYRGFRERAELARWRTAATLIQRRYREHLLTLQQTYRYQQLRNAAVCVQSRKRMMDAQRWYQRTKKAVITIQSCARMVIARGRFQQKKISAMIIQKHYRAMQLSRGFRYAFLVQKGAALTIQATYRGHVVRRELRKQTTAATLIQAHVRRFLCCRKFCSLKQAVIVCQRRYRAKLEGQQQHAAFLALRQAAIIMQKTYRAKTCRKAFVEDKNKVIKLQSIVRMVLTRRSYLRLKSAAKVVQVRFRAKRCAERTRRQFLALKDTVLRIQAHYRGYLVRRQLQEQTRAAVVIQAAVRRTINKTRFVQLKAATIACQRRYRASVIGNGCRDMFLRKKQAAIKLQTVFRGFCARKRYQQLRKAVISLQSVIRGRRQRERFQKLKHAAIVIQRRRRDKMMSLRVRAEFLQMRSAAIVMQSQWRMVVQRRVFVTRRRSAIVIQSNVRRCIAQQHYRKLKTAALRMQTLYRARKMASICRQQFLIQKGAALTIQAVYRGYLVRKALRHRNMSAVLIQSAYKGYLQRKTFLNLKHVTVICQRRYRAIVVKRRVQSQYEKVRQGVIRLQAVFRGKCSRQNYQRTRAAVVWIQSQARMKIAQDRYRSMKKAAVLLQTWFRGVQLARADRDQFLSKKRAIVVIQAHVRAMLARQLVRKIHAAIKMQSFVRMFIMRRRYLADRANVIVCQTTVRRYLAQKCCEELKQKTRAACIIQRKWRATKLAKWQREQFLQLKHYATVVQHRVRGVLATNSCRRKFLIKKGAAITIQACVRGYLARTCMRRETLAAETIQAAFRAYHQRKYFLRLKKSTLICQRVFRAKSVGKSQRDYFHRMKAAALCIQTCYRRYICQMQFKIYKKNAVTLQAAFRGYRDRKQFLNLRRAAILCQRLVRARNIGRGERKRYIRMRAAAVSIQSCYRRYRCQTQFQVIRRSTVRIQSWFRGSMERRRYLRQQSAAVVLQTYWRAEMACHKQVMRYKKLKEATVMMQSLYRGQLARQRCARIKAAVKIQAYVRMRKERQRYLAIQRAVVTLQAGARGWMARRFVDKLRAEQRKERQHHLNRFAAMVQANLAAMTIQRCYRNYLVMKVAKEKLHSVVTIQNWMRAKLQRLHYLSDRAKIVRLQGHVRSWLVKRDRAARVIQGVARRWLSGYEDRRRHQAAMLIQAVWRGYHTRRVCRSKKVTAVRHKILAATASATDDRKLCNRTASALDYLLKYKHLSQVLDALMHLDVATRLSGVCCERMVEANAICVLYRLVKGCNRSLPHMELIKYTLNILVNLAKYEKTRSSVYEVEDSLATLLELLQIYREKGLLFTKMCTLLGILALDGSFKQMIVEDTKWVERLRSVHMLTSRKHKLESSQRVTRARMNATMNTTYLVGSPVKKHKIKPDWSLHKDRMGDIECPLKAINFVLKNLGIPAK